jgi:polyisoprenyl-phosphate glycosyltransferase
MTDTRLPSSIFFSVVLVFRNNANELIPLLSNLSKLLAQLVSDHEIIIVDNASDDDSLNVLRQLTSLDGLPNLQVYALTKEVDSDVAAWVGLENSLGDFVAVIDPLQDGIHILPEMIEKALDGADVIFANNLIKPKQNLFYKLGHSVFNKLYKWFNGFGLSAESSQYRILSKAVINFILQHPQPSVIYRHLPLTAGFSRVNIKYNAPLEKVHKKRLGESVDRGIRLLVSTTRAPMRIVTSLSFFGALANFVYFFYVLAVSVFKDNVIPGWTSISLQQSGMFFLLSLVLLVLGEYILNMVSLQNDGPTYHVAHEFTSVNITRFEKLNIEEVGSIANKAHLKK